MFPEGREGLFVLIDGGTFAGHVVQSCFVLDLGFEDSLPVAQIYVQRGQPGSVDRTEWVVVNVFAAPGEAIPILENIGQTVCGPAVSVPAVGLFDSIRYEETPFDVPYQSDRVMQAQAVFRMTARRVRGGH